MPAVHQAIRRPKRSSRPRGEDARCRCPQRRDDDAQPPPPAASHPLTAASWNGLACRTDTGANHTFGQPAPAFPCSKPQPYREGEQSD